MVTEISGVSVDPSTDGRALSLSPALSNPKNGWPLRPFQIVSLADMFTFHAHNFFHAMTALQHFHRKAEETDFWAMSESDRAAYISWVEGAETWCAQYGINDQANFSRLLRVLRGENKLNTPIPSLINAVRHSISYELAQHKFMYMPDSEAKYYDQEQLFGFEVFESFPEAKLDIASAGTCIACGLFTASVYHSMRVAEFGLRRIAAKLRVRIKDKKGFVPVEYGTWEKVIDACKNKITKIRQQRVGPKRELALEFYSDAGDHCLFMKDIWRNNASHTRKPYNEPEAIAVLERVKDFMKFLTVNVP
jgi:hypothetical protein